MQNPSSMTEKSKSNRRPAGPGNDEMLVHPSICPAFRVRRGSDSINGAVTGRARRATRPTSCHFGAALVRSPLELRADIERWDALALHRSGERCSGMPRSRAGMPTGPTYPGTRKRYTTDSRADARAPTASCKQGSAVLNGPAPKQAVRSRAIERHTPAGLTRPRFYSVMFGFALMRANRGD